MQISSPSNLSWLQNSPVSKSSLQLSFAGSVKIYQTKFHCSRCDTFVWATFYIGGFKYKKKHGKFFMHNARGTE
jgi:hypothetical protein